MAQDTTKKTLTEEQLKNLQEIPFHINWKGIRDAYLDLTYTLPYGGFQTGMRKLEGVSRKMMLGKNAVIGMPVGIVLRNTARVAHNSSERKYAYGSRFVGGVAAIATVVAGAIFGAPLVVAGLATAGAWVGVSAAATTAAMTGGFGTIAAYAAAGTLSALLAPAPVFTAVTVATSTVLGGLAGLVSLTYPALRNLGVGLRRSKAARDGYELTEKQMEDMANEFDRESPTLKYERDTMQTATRALKALPDERRREIYTSLKAEFDVAAAPANDDAPAQDATLATSATVTAPARIRIQGKN